MLKDILLSPPTLISPKLSHLLLLYISAFYLFIATVLIQKDNANCEQNDFIDLSQPTHRGKGKTTISEKNYVC